jgi:uncharacterized protein (DUF1015 family)
MAEIRPFGGIRYHVSDAELSRVLAPPYDVIGEAYRDALYRRDPRNIVRVILSPGTGDPEYAEVGDTYRRWLANGTLAADPEPALYLLEQRFETEAGSRRRIGLLARFRAEDYERRSILPHEHTRRGPKEDRYRVLRSTRANFSPIFLMFPDEAGSFAALAARVVAEPAAAAYVDDGAVEHRLWCVTDARSVAGFTATLGAARSYIADGHHRYATALRYRDETGPDGAWTLGYFTPMNEPGLLVLPYHRILSDGPSSDEARRRLADHFSLSDAADVSAAAGQVARSTARYAFALAWPGGQTLLAEAGPDVEPLIAPAAPPSLRALDTWFFHEAVLGPLLGVPGEAVSYVHSLREAEETVAAGACRLAVLMRPTPVRQIVDVAEAGESMPAKSTFFHPKLPSGLVIHPLVA